MREETQLDRDAKLVTASSSMDDLIRGCRPNTGYTPTLRTNAYAHGSAGVEAVVRLRRALHERGVQVYPAFGKNMLDRDPEAGISTEGAVAS